MFYDLTKYIDIFVEKMREPFAMQKLLIFLDKNIGIFEILTFGIITSRSLTTSLVLNNLDQILYNDLYRDKVIDF